MTSPDVEAHTDTEATRDYVLPLVHARVPARVVDVGFLASLGAVAAVGAVEVPVVGVAAAGLFVLRRRHGGHEPTSTEEGAATQA